MHANVQESLRKHWIYYLIALVWAVLVARAVLNVKGPDALQPQLPQSQVESFAKTRLDAIQAESFADDKEMCGIIFETAEGELGSSDPKDGSEASCNIVYFDEPGMVPVASFHTHGSYSSAYDSEVPSTIDISSDISSRTDGYVATPGGRLWHIDHRGKVANLVCGPGCLRQDPDFRPCRNDPIATSYTIETLEQRFAAKVDC